MKNKLVFGVFVLALMLVLSASFDGALASHGHSRRLGGHGGFGYPYSTGFTRLGGCGGFGHGGVGFTRLGGFGYPYSTTSFVGGSRIYTTGLGGFGGYPYSTGFTRLGGFGYPYSTRVLYI